MTKYYNTKNISYFKNEQWLRGDEAIKELKLIESGDSNWDLFLDENRDIIYYIAKEKGCGSGTWGDIRYYERRRRASLIL